MGALKEDNGNIVTCDFDRAELLNNHLGSVGIADNGIIPIPYH